MTRGLPMDGHRCHRYCLSAPIGRATVTSRVRQITGIFTGILLGLWGAVPVTLIVGAGAALLRFLRGIFRGNCHKPASWREV